MRRSDYKQTEIHTEYLKKKDFKASSDFFNASHWKSSSKDKAEEKQVDAFLERSLAKSLPTKDFFPSKAFQQLFFKFNNDLKSPAAVECMFSVGKAVLKPKRARLRDEHFQILVFLKDWKFYHMFFVSNRLQYYVLFLLHWMTLYFALNI